MRIFLVPLLLALPALAAEPAPPGAPAPGAESATDAAAVAAPAPSGPSGALSAADAPAPAPAFDAAGVAAFAEHLFRQGDYYRAIGEYERALFLAPGAPERARWVLRSCEAYRRGDQPASAAECYDRALERFGDAVRGPALLGAAQSWLAAHRPETAVERARQAAAALAGEPARAREARYTEGWALLEAGRDREAAEAFRAARGEGLLGEGADKLLAVLPQLDDLPSRSPLAAGLLGVVPGLGHLYVGDYGTALSALVWNGVFGWAIYEAVQKKHWSLVVVLAMFESMWYGGSIVGAITGAHRFNRDARLNALDDLSDISPPDLSGQYRARQP